MRKGQNPHSRKNVMAAIQLLGAGMTKAEKRAVLQAMTDEVEQLATGAKAIRLGEGADPLKEEFSDR